MNQRAKHLGGADQCHDGSIPEIPLMDPRTETQYLAKAAAFDQRHGLTQAIPPDVAGLRARRNEDFAEIPPFLSNRPRYFNGALVRLRENNRRLQEGLATLETLLLEQCAQTEAGLDKLDDIIRGLEL